MKPRHAKAGSWENIELPHGLIARASRFTPRLVLADRNTGGPILALTRNEDGYVVRRGAGVEDGAPLGPTESLE